MATPADGPVEGGMRRREGARARRERRQRAEARLRLRLVRDAARLVAHRGGPHFGSQSKCVKEGDVHASHGALQYLHTPLPLVGRHVFVSSGVPALPILDNGGVVFGGGAGFSSMLESTAGPVRLLDPGPALFVEKALPSCSSLFPSTSLPVFSVSVGEGEAEVHRAVAEGVLRGTSSSSTVASPHAVAQSSKRSVSTAVAPKTKSARSTVLVDSGQGFAMENFVHVHEVMEGCREVLSWNSVLYSWHSSTWTKRGSGHAKIILDTEFGLRYFLFQKHGSTRVLGYFFIEGRGF